jgi:hypothetical protein
MRTVSRARRSPGGVGMGIASSVAPSCYLVSHSGVTVCERSHTVRPTSCTRRGWARAARTRLPNVVAMRCLGYLSFDYHQKWA